MNSAPILAALLLLASPLAARQVYQLGGASGRSWADRASLTFVDARSVPGSIRPFQTEASHNLVSTMRDRGGDISSLLDTYTLAQDWVDGGYEYVIDGDSTTAFVHPPRIKILGGGGGFWTVPMFFDLGAPFLVDRIRFITRPDHPENQMRRYLLYLNDGSDEAKDRVGNPVWTKYREDIDNLSSVVDLQIEPQMVRHVYLLPGTLGYGGGLSTTWEVAEFEVFGRGFVPSAEFVSAPIDLGQPSSLGALRWGWQLDPGAQIAIQTRSGSDDQPDVYWRLTGVGDEVSALDERGRPLTTQTYGLLRPNKRGGVTDDLENWSPWQSYELADGAGTQVLSPSPRRFLQVRIQFLSAGLAGGQVDSLRFDYSQPPVVASAVAEIHPNQVEAAASTPFTYAVRSRIEPGQSGFDAFQLRTAARVDSVLAVRIERETVRFAAEREPTGGGFLVRFPRIRTDQALLEVDFLARVFRYGTAFDGSLVDSQTDEVPLAVIPGDAVPEAPSDELRVRIGLESGLLAGLQVSPNPFSPNGDGVNDRVALSFSLLRLTGSAPVALRLFDLSGRPVGLLEGRAQGGSAFALEWDGRDDAGALVPPGLYLYRLAVDSDGGWHERVGHLAVAY